MKKLSLLLLLAGLLASFLPAEQSHLVISVHEATPTMKHITLEIQSVSQKKSWFMDLDRSPYDDGMVQTTFVAELPFSGKVKFVWWINSYFDESLKPRKGIVDKNTYVIKDGAWMDLPNVVAESNGNLDPDFMGHPLQAFLLSGYSKSTEAKKAHLFTYPDRWIARSLEAGDVVARVPPKDGQSNFDPCLLSFAPGTYGVVHPDSSFSDDPEWLITEPQDYEAGSFYHAVFENGSMTGVYPVEFVEVRTTK